MKKYICFLLFVLLYLISCTTGAGESQACVEAAEEEQEETIKEETDNTEKNSVRISFKNESPYTVTIFKDSIRDNPVCKIEAKESSVITRELFTSDIVYYVTYYINLSDDFSIPYFSNESYVIVPNRQSKFQTIVIAPPDALKLQSCYIILENESKKEVIFKYGTSELSSLDKDGGCINQSPVILPYEKGLYKIHPANFDSISNYFITTLSGKVCNLAEKIIIFEPGSVYKIVIKNKTGGNADCVLKSISSLNICTSDSGMLKEVKEVKISYITNSSLSSIADKKIPVGTSLSSQQLPELKRSGYNFAGWYMNNQKVQPGLVVMNDITLYAKWTLICYSASNLNQIELSKLENEYTLYVSGKITDSDLEIIASKIKKANKNITLDLKSTTGLSEISSSGISSSHFSNCTYLKSIILPSSILKIGNYAFTYCTYLNSVEISEGTTSLGNYPFWKCTGLKSVTIPKSITSLGYAPFSYCSSLNTINYRGTKAQWNCISKSNWRDNAYSYIKKVICTDGVIEL